ncbi:ras and EF-hand domain-containing protein homolog [Anabrus simplex]|uniref:ras and EF-hand domain-containing protein homolog n=1 Tax=Anabrus simplex TaxID=316456 RepID=UPI0035A27A67
MASGERQLQQLFRACDKQGSGHIGPDEFRELCTGFDIGPADSDAIFVDLDHDGDGKVSLEDFAWGFRDFLNPDSTSSRRPSVDVVVEELQKQQELERRHSLAQHAWSNLVSSVGLTTINRFLNTSAPKLADLYEELQASETCPELVQHFEGAFSSLMQDVKKLHEENKNLEEMFTREKEAHLAHLRSLEDELDAQVARVEQQARDEARMKYENDKKALTDRMEAEMAELQTQLHLFQKVNNVLSRHQTEKHGRRNSVIRQEREMENRELRNMLADTKTNLALLRSEMAHLKSTYEEKCHQLNQQQETVTGYIQKNDHIHRQLQLLHEANSKLQDTNDSLLSVLDVPSPRPSSPCCCSRASSAGSGSKHHRPYKAPSGTSSDIGSVVDSAPSSLGPFRLDHRSETRFGIQRLMDDLDSGRSTLRDQVDNESDKSILEELSSIGSPPSMIQFDPDFDQNVVNTDATRSTIRASELEPTGPPDRTFKIIFAGDAAVGKSCFIVRFCKGVFLNKLGSTLGVDFQVKTIRVDDRNVTLQLWDTAGQERFRSMTKAYFRRADGVLLLYDVTNERSFLNVQQWVQDIDEVTNHQVPIVLCGNKVDLRNEYRAQGVTCVESSQGDKLARDCGALFVETSSKTGKNVIDAVITLCREMLTREDVEVQTSALRVTEEDKKMLQCCSGKK